MTVCDDFQRKASQSPLLWWLWCSLYTSLVWLSKPTGPKSLKKLLETRVNEGVLGGGEGPREGEEGEDEESKERHDGWMVGVGGVRSL